MQTPGGLVQDDPPTAQSDDAVGEVDGELHLVQRGNHRQLVLGRNLLEQTHDFPGGYRVEGRHRFVRQEDLGMLHERSRDGHALLLTAGQRVGTLVGPVGETHAVQLLECLPSHALGIHHQRQPGTDERSESAGAHVLEHGHRTN